MPCSCEIDGAGETVACVVVGEELSSMITRERQEVRVCRIIDTLSVHGDALMALLHSRSNHFVEVRCLVNPDEGVRATLACGFACQGHPCRGTRAGPHQVIWDGRDDVGHTVASGVYLYRVATGDEVAARKMVLLK